MADQPPFPHLLVPMDDSDLAHASIPFVRALATRSSDVLLLSVIPEPTLFTEVVSIESERLERMHARRLDEASLNLERIAAHLRAITPHVRTRTVVGLPADEILRVAGDEDIDLIIMATHGRGFLGRVAIGSVADRVARSATAPVLLVNPHQEEAARIAGGTAPMRRIVVPLDGSGHARQALGVARELAGALDVPLHLVQVIDLRGEWIIDEEDDEEIVAPIREEIEETLRTESIALRDAGFRVDYEVQIGPVARRIGDTISAGDVIVMTSHGAGGIRRWLLGSVAENLIHSGIAPVMLVPIRQRARLADAVKRAGQEMRPDIT